MRADSFDLTEVAVQFLLITAHQFCIQEKSPLSPTFDIAQGDVASGVWTAFLFVEDVNDQKLMLFHRQFLESSAPAVRVEQIADDDHQPGMRKETAKGMRA